MRAKPMFLFLIAIVCGLVASVSVSQFMESKSKGITLEMVKIFVAATEISSGDKLEAEKVKLVEWPKDRVPEGVITNMDDFKDKFSRTRMYADEPILQSKIADRNALKSAAPTIPEGYRVVAVKVDVDSVVAGLVQPGDRVDLILVMKKGNESPEAVAKTILKDVNVFAVDAETERSVDKDGRAIIAKTVSLLVKPPQMETVILASEMGRLTLALRRPNDVAEDDTRGATASELLGKKAERTEERRGRLPADGESFVKFWQSLAKVNEEPAPQPPAPVEEPEEAKPPRAAWNMDIYTSSGQRRYEWMDMKQPPREVITSPVPAAPPAAPGGADTNAAPGKGHPPVVRPISSADSRRRGAADRRDATATESSRGDEVRETPVAGRRGDGTNWDN